jgi:hypothetical protein
MQEKKCKKKNKKKAIPILPFQTSSPHRGRAALEKLVARLREMRCS